MALINKKRVGAVLYTQVSQPQEFSVDYWAIKKKKKRKKKERQTERKKEQRETLIWLKKKKKEV